MSAKRVRPQPQTPLARIFANTAWMLGGKGFGAICGLAYLAILTRTLGLKGYGHFSLIFGTALALIAVAGFQTWRVVVRYGSRHVHDENWPAFGRLSMLCGAFDALGAMIGCVIAAIAIYGFGHILALNQAYTDVAFAFSCASLWALVSAPTGMVRALHRFDLSVYVEALVPIGRVLSAAAIWFTGPSVGRFLFAWAVIDLIEAAAYWLVARRLCPEAVRWKHLRDWRLALKENPGLGHFFWVTYASSTLEATIKQGPLLAVGGLVGTKAAGLYRLASQLSQALSKLSSLLTRSVYAEVARARVATTAAEFRKLAMTTSLAASLAGALVIAVAAAFGKPLLAMIAGHDFEGGAVVLVPLAVAASFELASVVFEPVLHSTGRAGQSLIARVVGCVVLAMAIYVTYNHGAEAIAWSVAAASFASFLVMGAMALSALREVSRAEGGNDAIPDPSPDPREV